MTFEEIVQDAKTRRFAVIFTGIQANFLCLALQLLLNNKSFREEYPLMEDILEDCRASLAKTLGGYKFMDLDDFEREAEKSMKDFARKIVEQTASKASVSDGESG